MQCHYSTPCKQHASLYISPHTNNMHHYIFLTIPTTCIIIYSSPYQQHALLYTYPHKINMLYYIFLPIKTTCVIIYFSQTNNMRHYIFLPIQTTCAIIYLLPHIIIFRYRLVVLPHGFIVISEIKLNSCHRIDIVLVIFTIKLC